jgi:hypothetical protein
MQHLVAIAGDLRCDNPGVGPSSGGVSLLYDPRETW